MTATQSSANVALVGHSNSVPSHVFLCDLFVVGELETCLSRFKPDAIVITRAGLPASASSDEFALSRSIVLAADASGQVLGKTQLVAGRNMIDVATPISGRVDVRLKSDSTMPLPGGVGRLVAGRLVSTLLE